MSKESLPGLLRGLHLSTMASMVEDLTRQAEHEGWSHERYLRSLLDKELFQRSERKKARLLKESCLPEGKTLETLNQERLPLKVQRRIPGLLEGRFVKETENILAFGLPGRGKTHVLCAIARELLLSQGIRVLFIHGVRLVQQLLIAKRDLKLESFLKKLDRFDIILLDDIGYVQQNQEEMEVLFTFLSDRYERKSLMITSNLVFSEWDKIFKNPITTAAAIDRLVHHSIILELNNDSYRMQHAKNRQKGGQQ